MRVVATLLAAFVFAISPAQSGNLAALLKYAPPPGFALDKEKSSPDRRAYFGKAIRNYSPSVMLKAYRATPNQTAKSLGRDTVAAMSQGDDIKVLRHGEVEVAGKVCYFIRLDIGLYGGRKISQRQIIAIHKGKAIVWTCSAEAERAAPTLAAFDRSLAKTKWL